MNRKKITIWAMLLGIYYLITFCMSIRISYGFPIKNLSLFVFSDGWISYSTRDLIKDITINIVTYIPIGYMLVKLGVHPVNKNTKYLICVTLGCALSVIKEVFQLLTLRGCCDINDVFFNIVGTIVGVIFCVLFTTVKPNTYEIVNNGDSVS